MTATINQSSTWRSSAVFLVLASFACYTIQGHTLFDGGDKQFAAHLINYSKTGWNFFDFYLNLLITFFTYAFVPGTTSRAFCTPFKANLLAFVTVLELEGVRLGASRWMWNTTLWGTLYQMFAMGITAPLYFALWLHEYPSPRSNGNVITATGANGAILGVLLGYGTIVLSMFWIGGPTQMCLYQFMPVFVWCIRESFIWMQGEKAVPSSIALEKAESNGHPGNGHVANANGANGHVNAKVSKDGYDETLRIYLLVAAVATFCHIKYALIPIFTNAHPWTYFKELFIPSLLSPPAATTTPTGAAHHFLQWDHIMTMYTTILGGIWDMDSETKLNMIIWTVLATILTGPGTALIGVWAWREKMLRELRVGSPAS